MPKRVKYNGEWYDVLEERQACRSNDSAVKMAYRISEAAWVLDVECEEIDGQDNS